MALSIRRSQQHDYDALIPLFRQVHEFHVLMRPDVYKENETPVERGFFENQLINDKQHIFVACIDTDIAGVIVTKEEEVLENTFVKARTVLLIQSLCVAEIHRNKGIGKKLTEYVFDLGRSLKVDSIELGVLDENTAAIEFYQRVGMKTKSRRMEILL